MNYWLIIRLPILFAIGVSDVWGQGWQFWPAQRFCGKAWTLGVSRGPLVAASPLPRR